MSDADALAGLRELRARDPRAFADAVTRRRRRPVLRGDGRLLIVAADHPARGALGVGADAMAMADRGVLLERLAIALRHPGVDGVLGTADIVEDLAAMGLLDEKLVVGSVNRGGLRGASFELDDRVTGYDVRAGAARGLDLAKILLRVDLADAATVATLERAARVVDRSAAAGMPILIEPFLSSRARGAVVNDLSPDAVIRSIAIASGLGSTSAFSWLKLPVVAEMERVMAATTLPVLLLGGDVAGDQGEMYRSWERALRLPGVRGLTVGRTVLYPPDGDVAGAIDAAARLVHAPARP